MAEPILKRVQRIVSAGLESATDAAERLNGGGMMRHAIREVDQAIDKVKARHEAAKTCSLQASWRQAAIRDQVADLARDARFALDKGREDLAQAAVSRQLDLEEEARRLSQQQSEADREAAQLAATIEELRGRKAQMEQDYAALEIARREAQALGRDPKLDRKVQRAEGAFERARQRVGCTPSVVHQPEGPELQALKEVRREDEIAARMAALRGGGTPAPAAPARGGRRKAAA